MVDTRLLNDILNHSESFHQIYDENPIGIAVCDREGNVADCNPAYLATLGVRREAIIGYNIFDSYNFTDEVMEKIRTSDAYEYEVLYTMPKDIFKDSSVSTISIEVKIVRRQQDGHTAGYTIYITNHTRKWKEYEEQLDAQERRYRNLIDNLPMDYTHSKLIFDENGQIVDYLNMSGNKHCNEFYIRHNMTWGETLASKFLHTSGHHILGKLNELWQSGATGGHFTYDAVEVGEIYEMVAVFEEGKWVNLISIPITNLEKARREAEENLIRNLEREQEQKRIAEQKRREKEAAYQEQLIEAKNEADRANAAKTEFLLRMSHDIRTPLNGIIGMLNIAEHFPEDMEKQSECRKKVKSSSKILLELINEVLDMSKLESGEIVLEHVPFRLSEIVRDVFNVIQKQAEERGIVIVEEGCSASVDRLIGSPVHFKRLLMNILSNAVKYNRDGGKIYIGCREVGRQEGTVLLEFQCRDTGIGMSPEFVKRVFEPFSQENEEARSRYGGTGLGMSIARNLAEKMGGSIKAESVQGEGSTFTVRIPFELDCSEQEEIVQKKADEKPSIKGLHIILAEDNALNMEIAHFLLEEEGAVIIEAWNGQEALDALLRSEPGSVDAILMDVMMPVMDGYEATRRIRALDRPDAARIPIIAMTANAFTEDKVAAKKAGMSEHLAKPLDTGLLVRTVAELVKAYRGNCGFKNEKDNG